MNESETQSATEPEITPVLNIVALDDDGDFREYVRGLLEAEGHETRVVAMPDEFFAACDERLPDIALLDIKMGKHSGEAVLKELRDKWPRLCVIVVTGYPSMRTMRNTFKQDVFDYLAKPFSLDELRTVLAQAAAAYDLGVTAQARLRGRLGREIRLARTAKAWTLKELSEESGVSISQLSSIERGAHLPSLESLLAVAHALEATPSDWLKAAGF